MDLTGTVKLNLDFRPPGQGSTTDAEILNIPDGDKWVEGNAGATYYPETDHWNVGVYVWRGPVGESIRKEIERRTGVAWEWEEYGGGNGHEGGTLRRATPET